MPLQPGAGCARPLNGNYVMPKRLPPMRRRRFAAGSWVCTSLGMSGRSGRRRAASGGRGAAGAGEEDGQDTDRDEQAA